MDPSKAILILENQNPDCRHHHQYLRQSIININHALSVILSVFVNTGSIDRAG